MSIPSSASSTPENGVTAEAGDIRGLKPLETFSYPFYVYAGGAFLALLLLALLFFLYRRLRRRAQNKPVVPSAPPEPLDVVILRKLDHLKRAALENGQDLRLIHFDLSETFRDYLERRFGFSASDWTTEEIIAFLQETPSLNSQTETIQKLLRLTDEVKFADSHTDAERTLSLIEEAITFVEAFR